jgi:hypothetical protein
MQRAGAFAAVAIAAVVSGAATSSSAAAVLVTSLLERSGHSVTCSIVNLSDKDIDVRAEAVEVDGTPHAVLFTLAPAEGRSGGGFGPAVGSDQVYCRFEITGTSKKKVRAAICVHAGDFTTGCMATSDAR